MHEAQVKFGQFCDPAASGASVALRAECRAEFLAEMMPGLANPIPDAFQFVIRIPHHKGDIEMDLSPAEEVDDECSVLSAFGFQNTASGHGARSVDAEGERQQNTPPPSVAHSYTAWWRRVSGQVPESATEEARQLLARMLLGASPPAREPAVAGLWPRRGHGDLRGQKTRCLSKQIRF